MPSWEIREGDSLAVLKAMPSDSVDCVVTSPPYWGLRDYGVDGQMGLEPTPEAFVAAMVEVFREVRRVLKPTGTAWVNLGDSYAGSWGAQGRQGKTGKLAGRSACAHRQIVAAAKRKSGTGSLHRTPGLKPKDLVGIPWRVAFALQAGFATCSACRLERRADLWPVHNGHRVCIDCLLAQRLESKVIQTESGWFLRQDIIWAKKNCMPESVKDRCTKAHEYFFLFAKSGSPTIWRAQDTLEWALAPDHSERLPDPSDEEPDATKPRWLGFDYFFDAKAISEPSVEPRGPGNLAPIKALPGERDGENHNLRGSLHKIGPSESRNRRSVWWVATQPVKQAHFATMPMALVEPCILAGSVGGGRSYGSLRWQRDHGMRRAASRPELRGHRAEPGIRGHGAPAHRPVRSDVPAPLQ